MTITQLNSRKEIEPALQAEFKREFGLCAPEVIEEAFRAWRRAWAHNPSISDIRKLIDEAENEKRRLQDEKRVQQERKQLEQGREEGKVMGLEQLREILSKFVEPQKKPAYVPLSEEELKRRRDEQLKAVKEKFGERTQENAPGNEPRSDS